MSRHEKGTLDAVRQLNRMGYPIDESSGIVESPVKVACALAVQVQDLIEKQDIYAKQISELTEIVSTLEEVCRIQDKTLNTLIDADVKIATHLGIYDKDRRDT